MSINKHPPILLLSPPAGGKTYGMRSISPELGKRTLHINCDTKALPWIDPDPNATKFKEYVAACPTLIPSIINQAIASKQFDLIIVDTITIAMGEFARRFINSTFPKYVYSTTQVDGVGNPLMLTDTNYVSITSKASATQPAGVVDSMSGWGRYATLALDIVAAGAKADSAGIQLVVMGHLDDKPNEAGEYSFKCPIQGSVGKAGLEGLFSIVMHAKSMKLDLLQGKYAQDHKWLGTTESKKFTKSRYVYQVDHTEDTVATHDLRTIDGLWPEDVIYIDNNFQMIFDRFKEVYGE